MQLLGIEVDAINSVQFSNNTGYPSWKGEALDGDQLWALVEGLEGNNLLTHTHLLTGYMRSPAILRTCLKTLDNLRAKNASTVYVCDPVMGDEGQLYVPKDVVPIYRNEVVPRATVLTPNQFEAEILTDMKITTQEDALTAIEKLHVIGPKIVIITSCLLSDAADSIALLASWTAPTGAREKFRINIPKIANSFTGTGDLMASLVLSWLHKTNDLKTAIQNATTTVQAVLAETMRQQRQEICLIQCREQILNPNVPEHLKAVTIGK